MSSSAASTWSSRASTPAGEDSPAILSPRSRLQKLLAPFDEDSDDEALVRTLPKSKVTVPVAQLADVTKRVIDASPEKDDDDEDEPVFRPRGRMAARMAGAAAPIQQESESSEDEDEDVYQRIRRDLMAKNKKTTTATAHQQETPVQPTEEPTTAESPHATPPRERLLTRTHCVSTPASTRSKSPGLFMSPAANSGQSDGDSSDDDSLPNMDNPTRLRELVNRRRAERLAKEQAEREAAEERAQSGQAPLSDLFDDEDQRDETTERRLTQHSKSTRKASKKALEELNRETQRMKRNMQLTHQAKVKKRFTAQDFLSTFNHPRAASRLANVTSATDVTSSSPPPEPMSDATAGQIRDTPPSSPPSASEDAPKSVPVATHLAADVSNEDLLTLDEIKAQPVQKIDKGKAPAYEIPTKARKPSRKVRGITQKEAIMNRPDDDLQIVSNRFAMFDEVPPVQNSEAKTLLMLRHLAHISNPEKTRLKKGQKPSMTPGQLELQLRQRARDIANQERAERLSELRAKGIFVMTEEEREREQLQIEDMLTRARQEAEDLRKKEKASAKAAGGTDNLSSDESEDGDYAASDEEVQSNNEEEGENEDFELSGSEGEDNAMVGAKADEDDPEEDEQQQDDDTVEHTAPDDPQDEESTTISMPTARKARRKHVIEDDEEDDDNDASPTNAGINDDLAAAFGFGPAPTPPMGMSQMFAGTMADSQTQADTKRSDFISMEQDSLELLRHIPSAPIPTYDPSVFLESQDAVADSQVGNTQAKELTQQVEFNFTRPALDSPSLNSLSQFSEIPDPSQDVGLALDRTPLVRGIEPSTADTVLLGVPESPVVQKRGRLLRRSEVNRQFDDVVPSTAPEAENISDAFAVMRQAAKKTAQEDFDRKKSNAKGMVDEQAEESEDEFAGMGGASDDESGGEADEADKQMIDESDVKVDERKLAAYFAEKARAQDEAQTSKLYKDLMSGNLRRKRGNAFELDSDEDDQLVERRRRKQREEARKRRLLLQDETVGKLGANEKKEAFLRAIEDRDSADELDFLDGHDADEDTMMTDSQPTDPQQQGEPAPLSQVSGDTLKRPSEAEPSQPRKKPASLRRSQWESFKKPKSLAEVRESVSFLIDEPNGGEESLITLSDSEHEDDAAAVAERLPATERRTAAKPDIIDRLTLKKQSSTVESASNDSMAFVAPNRSFSSFKAPPSLLRKSTTGLSADSVAMPPPALGREDSGVRRGGSKKSSINYQAREAERKVVVERAERRKADNVKKIAGMRRKAGALGMLGHASGSFE